VDHPPLPGWLQHLEPGTLGLARDGVHGRLGRRVRGTADDDPLIRILQKVTALRLGAFVINVAAVVWLLWSKRLFGLNGGGAAYRAEHSAESLLTVERAAHESDQSAEHNVGPQPHAAAPRGGRSDS